jgi:hypothetical protein
MAATLPEFDPQIIERHVEGLLRKSSAFVIGSVVLGVMLGAAFGATPLTSLGSSWPIPRTFGFATLLIGGIVGGIVGYVIGDTRSFMYKLQAQIAMAQVKAARDSAAVLELLHAAAKVAPPKAPAQPSESVETGTTFQDALDEARAADGVSVIVIPVDREQRVGGYESWWDVPVAEVSPLADVQRARAEYEHAKATRIG